MVGIFDIGKCFSAPGDELYLTHTLPVRSRSRKRHRTGPAACLTRVLLRRQRSKSRA